MSWSCLIFLLIFPLKNQKWKSREKPETDVIFLDWLSFLFKTSPHWFLDPSTSQCCTSRFWEVAFPFMCDLKGRSESRPSLCMQWSFPQVKLQIPPAWENSRFGKTDPVTCIVADTHWSGEWVLTQGWKKGEEQLHSWWLFVQLLPVEVVVSSVSLNNLGTDGFFRDQGDVILPLTLWSGSGTTELQPDSREYANFWLLNMSLVRKSDLANWCVPFYPHWEYPRV